MERGVFLTGLGGPHGTSSRFVWRYVVESAKNCLLNASMETAEQTTLMVPRPGNQNVFRLFGNDCGVCDIEKLFQYLCIWNYVR